MKSFQYHSTPNADLLSGIIFDVVAVRQPNTSIFLGKILRKIQSYDDIEIIYLLGIYCKTSEYVLQKFALVVGF